MKERVNRGFTGAIVLAVILFFLAIFWGFYEKEWILSFGSAENMYKQGIIYFGNNDYSLEDTDGSVYAVNVYDIFDLGESRSGYNLYSVAIDAVSTDGEPTIGYGYLEAKSNDKNVKKLLDAYEKDAKAFAKAYNCLFVEAERLSYEEETSLSDITATMFKENNEAIAVTDNRYILKVTSVWYELLWAYGVIIVLFAIIIGSLYSAFKAKKLNRFYYDKLYELDPSLKDNLSELPGRATYSDTAIGAFIYRDHLILTSRSFRIFSLSDMRWIYYTEKKTKYYGIITVATEYLLNVFSEIDNKHVNQAVSITNSKKLKTNIEELLGYIYSKYPNVIVGFNRETQAAYAVVKNNNTHQ